MEEFTTIDIILGAFIGFGAIAGFVRGLTRELARTICYAISATVAWFGCNTLGDILVEKLNVLHENRVLLSFILLFVGSYIVLWGVRLIGRGIAKFEFRTVWEKTGGVFLGSLKNAVGVALLLLYTAVAQPMLTHDTLIENSRLGTLVQTHLAPQYEKFAESNPEWYRPPSWTPAQLEEYIDNDQPSDQGRDTIED